MPNISHYSFFFFWRSVTVCVCPFWWLWWTEDMYVRDTVKASPTISHDWFCPLPVGGRDKHIPHRAWWDRLCTENAIVTEKHIFPDKAALLLLPLSSFLTLTNTLSLIDGIVSNHTSLFLFVFFFVPHTKHTKTYTVSNRVCSQWVLISPIMFITVSRERI